MSACPRVVRTPHFFDAVSGAKYRLALLAPCALALVFAAVGGILLSPALRGPDTLGAESPIVQKLSSVSLPEPRLVIGQEAIRSPLLRATNAAGFGVSGVKVSVFSVPFSRALTVSA
jgi:hypothetical protein